MKLNRKTRAGVVAGFTLAVIIVSYGSFLVRPDFSYGDDDLEYTVPITTHALSEINHGGLSWWVFGTGMGTPAWTVSPALGPCYPVLPLFMLFDTGTALAFSYLLFLLLAGLGTWLLIKRLGCPVQARAIGAIWFVLCGHIAMQVNQGYFQAIIASSFLPWLLLVAEAAMDDGIIYSLLAGLVLAVPLLSGHLVVDSIILITFLSYCLARGIFKNGIRGAFKGGLIFATAIIAGFLAAAFLWLPGLSDLLANASPRPYLTQTLSWSSLWRIACYWLPLSDPGQKGMEFAGSASIMLAISGLFSNKFLKKNSKAVPVGFVIVLVGILAILSPRSGLLEKIRQLSPVFKMFSHVWFFGLTFSMGMVIAGAAGLSSLLSLAKEKPWLLDTPIRAVVITALVLALVPPALYLFVSGNTVDTKILNGAISSVPWILIVAAGLSIPLVLARQGMLKANTLADYLVMTAVIEMIVFSFFSLDHEGPRFHENNYYKADPLIHAVKKEGIAARVLMQQSITPEKNWMIHRNQGLMQALDLANFSGKVFPWFKKNFSDELDGFTMLHTELALASKGGSDPRHLKKRLLTIKPGSPNNRLFNLANVGYIILDRQRRLFGGVFKPVLDWGTARVWLNRNVQKGYRLVHKARSVSDSIVFGELGAPDHNISKEVFLAPGAHTRIDVSGCLPGDQSAQVKDDDVKLIRKGKDSMYFVTNSSCSAYLVVSETWHRYWRAMIDGIEKPVLRAEGCFMAVALPKGKHEVLLKFSPPVFTGLAISIGWLAMLAILFFFHRVKRPRK
ncbi:MAG: hypothetical protein GXP49_13610 [Deltaproteobacteria bacterium]|nr:hypothetical protein [Deltaproteobacteria bacterium]